MTKYTPKRKKVERAYRQALYKIAQRVGEIVNQHDVAEYPHHADQIQYMLEEYSRDLEDWARSAGMTMVKAAEREDRRLWQAMGSELSKGLRAMVNGADMTQTREQLVIEQVDLIKSIPTDAAKRVNKLAQEAMIGGSRGEEIRQELLKTTSVTKSHAELIARTEAARTTSRFTQARAQSVGSSEYLWRTAGDSDVRPGHRAMANRTFRWDTPPAVDEGDRVINHGPGEIWNCFTGDTPVSLVDGCTDLFRMPFAGPIFDIDVDGVTLSMTANHPAMTARGWVSAAELNVGDQLLQRNVNDGFVGDDDVDESMPTFNDLFLALGGATEDHAASVEFNFHGDRPNGHVDHVALGGHLSRNGPSVAFKKVANRTFAESNGGVGRLGFSGGSPHIVETDVASLGDEFTSLIGSCLGHSGVHSIGSTANGDALSFDSFLNSQTGAVKATGQSEDTLAGLVSSANLGIRQVLSHLTSSAFVRDCKPLSAEMLAERVRVSTERGGNGLDGLPVGYRFASIRNIRVRYFSGHVYTMGSDTGKFMVTPAKIISKNCRCYPEPLIPE